MLVIPSEVDRFRRATDGLARQSGRFLRAAIRGSGPDPVHLKDTLGLILALTGVTMSEEGREALKVIDLGGESGVGGADLGTAATANYLRALVASGFSGFDRTDEWLDTQSLPPAVKRRWVKVQKDLSQDMAFIAACGVDPDTYTQIRRVSLYFSSRVDLRDIHLKGQASMAGHLLVVRADAMKTDDALVRRLAQWDNPILIQATSNDNVQTLLNQLQQVDRLRCPGRIIVSLQLGADDVPALIPLVEAVATLRPATVWAFNPVSELADPQSTSPSVQQTVERTAALSGVVRSVGSQLRGLDLELHSEQLDAAPVVLASLGVEI